MVGLQSGREGSAALHKAFAVTVDSSETDPGSKNLVDSAPQPLRFGIGAVQGPRETMEDVVQVIERGRCNFLFASKLNTI